MGFPDVCLTPAAPVPLPIPYPNLALNAMAVPFSPNIMVGFMPALNMGAKIPLTNGDNAGVANPLFMQMGQYTIGNPLVFVNCMPAINLVCPTTGNMMNNPIGAVLVPSVTTTLYTDAATSERLESGLGAPQLSALGDALCDSEGDTVTATREGGLAHVRIRRFIPSLTTRVFSALQRVGFDDIERVEIDLRGNPGGDAEAALRLADDFVEAGTLLAIRVDECDEHQEVCARQTDPYQWPLTLIVDSGTGSAAELFAGALLSVRRARIVGTTTAGKATSQALISNGPGSEYRSVCHWLLPDGTTWEGCGLRF